MIAFTLQIYYDFSGYSDMAIGVARMLGYRLPENFNYPYISQSITEFWRRWHITLSNWFRDYVYFPLERSHRKTTLDRYVNILIVFLLTGLWHGASWSFILWGLAQGVFIVFERTPAGAWLLRLWRPIRHVYALLAILFSWIIFQSASIADAFTYLKVMLGLGGGEAMVYPQMFLTPENLIALIVGIMFSLPLYPFILSLRQRLQGEATGTKLLPGVMDSVSTGMAILLLALTMVYLANSTVKAFIYFRF
jgi:alginate O-acetyltransferase complex protein AlgI